MCSSLQSTFVHIVHGLTVFETRDWSSQSVDGWLFAHTLAQLYKSSSVGTGTDIMWTCAFVQQNGRVKAAIVKKSALSVKQDQSLQNDNCGPSNCDRLLLPLSHIKPCSWCLWPVANICDLRNLVCCFLDSWPVSKVVAYQPWNLLGPAFTQVCLLDP